MSEEKRAPVQGYPPGIPWEMHLRAYEAYCKKWSPQPALIEGWCRGGFGTEELDDFIPGWREELSDRKQMQDEIATLRARIAVLEAVIEPISAEAAKMEAELHKYGKQPDDRRCWPTVSLTEGDFRAAAAARRGT